MKRKGECECCGRTVDNLNKIEKFWRYGPENSNDPVPDSIIGALVCSGINSCTKMQNLNPDKILARRAEREAERLAPKKSRFELVFEDLDL